VQEVAAQDVGFRKLAFPADGAGRGGNQTAVPRLRCRLVSRGCGRAHQVAPERLLVVTALVVDQREQQEQLIQVPLAQPPEGHARVGAGAADVKLAHGGFHAPRAVADEELVKGGCRASVTSGQRLQLVSRELRGVEAEPD
jgi:hypothetical protein